MSEVAPSGAAATPPAPLSANELRIYCRALLSELGIRPPLDPEVLCEHLAAHRGRPIALVPGRVPPGAASGALVVFPSKDLILYQSATTRPHQAHIIFHEVIHLVRGHCNDGQTVCGSLLDRPGGSRNGTLYDHWQEWEAETGATILSEWTESARGAVEDGDAVARRLRSALGGSGQWR